MSELKEFFANEFDLAILESDIEDGIAKDCYDCPTALALGRILPGTHEINVKQEYSDIDSGRWVISHPPKLRRWIQLFDEGRTTQPILLKITPDLIFQ